AWNRWGKFPPPDNQTPAWPPSGPLKLFLTGKQPSPTSAIIDPQTNPAAGDVLVITGARQAGVVGPGTYISNGGTLRLDTVLNQGDVATRSDTLVVDGTSVGPLGPTNMFVRNAGGPGVLTVNDGILVVQVLDPNRSNPSAFSLNGGRVTAGAFDYFLFHGGVTQGSQGNWYLRNEVIAPPPPPPPGPGPGPEVI